MTDCSSSPLTLRLFGPFEVYLSGAPLPRLRSRKGHWLLALLAMHAGRAVERAWLTALLWPESSERAAFANLRSSLKDLRRALGPEAARLRSSTPRTLCFDLYGADVDLRAFDAAIAQGDPASLERATALYRGPLLERCTEEWAFAERQAREQAYLQALETLAAQALAAGDAAAAERWLRQAVGVDPLRETAQRSLMQALVSGGNYGAALLVYRELRLRLHREINAEPDPETQALFQQLRTEGRAAQRTSGQRQRAVWQHQRHPPGAGAGSADGDASRLPSGALPDASRTFMPDRRTAPGSPVSQPAFRHNLPTPLTRFIGREREIAEVKRLLAGNRLLTLTGTGGCGKSRLALQVAAGLAGEFADGVLLVELAALADPALVPQSVASVLGLHEEPGRLLAAILSDYLQPMSLLLVLDNCEHLLSACAELADVLLKACSRLCILATSRQSFGLVGEQSFRVPSLSSPDPRHLPPLDNLQQFDAVDLFTDRALLSQPTFAITEANALAVVQVCQQLDGIPLAIELAAVWVKVLPVEQMAKRLDDRFCLLTGGSRTALPRHKTLRSSMDWSYGLLAEPEQKLLRRLSVFAGGWTLAAAEAVCAREGVDESDVLGLLARLVDRSLVTMEEAWGAPVRYRLLETVRQYSQERLLAAGEADALRVQHARWFLALAEEAEPCLIGGRQAEWLARLEAEHDNIRAVLAWSRTETGDAATGLRLAGALLWFWTVRGFFSEARQWLMEALAAPSDAPLAARARARDAAANLAYFQRDISVARPMMEENVAIWRELGDRRRLAYALRALAWAALDQGDLATGRLAIEESLSIYQALGDQDGIARSLNYRAHLVGMSGDFDAARELWEQSLTLAREVHDLWLTAWLLNSLGEQRAHEGDIAAARRLLEESLALRQELRDKRVSSPVWRGLRPWRLPGESPNGWRGYLAQRRRCARCSALPRYRTPTGMSPRNVTWPPRAPNWATQRSQQRGRRGGP